MVLRDPSKTSSLILDRLVAANDTELWKHLYQTVYEYDLPLMVGPNPGQFYFVQMCPQGSCSPQPQPQPQPPLQIVLQGNEADVNRAGAVSPPPMGAGPSSGKLFFERMRDLTSSGNSVIDVPIVDRFDCWTHEHNWSDPRNANQTVGRRETPDALGLSESRSAACSFDGLFQLKLHVVGWIAFGPERLERELPSIVSRCARSSRVYGQVRFWSAILSESIHDRLDSLSC